MYNKFKVYERDIDAGQGIQTLLFYDGICVSQSIKPKGNGYYTGDGNPEFGGLSPRKIGMKVNHFHLVTGLTAEIEINSYFYQIELAEHEYDTKAQFDAKMKLEASHAKLIED